MRLFITREGKKCPLFCSRGILTNARSFLYNNNASIKTTGETDNRDAAVVPAHTEAGNDTINRRNSYI